MRKKRTPQLLPTLVYYNIPTPTRSRERGGGKFFSCPFFGYKFARLDQSRLGGREVKWGTGNLWRAVYTPQTGNLHFAFGSARSGSGSGCGSSSQRLLMCKNGIYFGFRILHIYNSHLLQPTRAEELPQPLQRPVQLKSGSN